MILAGRVSLNGEVVKTLGTPCSPDSDVVAVDGKRIEAPAQHVYLAVYKPPGYVSTVRDRHARLRVVDLAPAKFAGRVKPVGRLDKESEGLILLTDDGRLIHQLTHPRYHVEKEYEVGVRGQANAFLVRKLVKGIELDDGPARALDASVVRRNPGGGVVRVVLGEGRKRQLRRMFRALGCRVEFLRRVRIGPLRLGQLAKGGWRHLTKAEVRLLYRATGSGQKGNSDSKRPEVRRRERPTGRPASAGASRRGVAKRRKRTG